MNHVFRTLSHHFSCLLLIVFLGACASTIDTHTPLPEYDVTYGEAIPDDALTQLRMADKLAQGANIETALAMYQRLAEENPELVTPIIRQALVHERQKRVEQADKLFTQSFEKKPANLHLAMHYSRFLETYKPEKLVTFWEKAAPELRHVRGWHKLGVSYDLAGQHEKALTAYNQGLRLNSRDSFIRNNKALSLAAQGKFREAETLFKSLSQDFPDEQIYVSNLIITLILADQIDAATSLAKQHDKTSDSHLNTLMSQFAPIRQAKPLEKLERMAQFQQSSH